MASQEIDEVSSTVDGKPLSTRREHETAYDQVVREVEDRVSYYNLDQLKENCLLMSSYVFRIAILPLMLKTFDRHRHEKHSANELKNLFMREHGDIASEIADVFWFHDDCKHNLKPGKRNQCFKHIYAHMLDSVWDYRVYLATDRTDGMHK